ncbi:uncharacterized protein BJ171DRAFT_539659 [Polychytrium aggregatum]|uniref:uncharacterized protein n=1 Tax=Polychytrium aggregatum TaxID=110093 RepID=UPI0022FE16E3|nr:uncharacterized protein BJ171DRAFT_539659 [Polychytrium aggregatum]KAI9190816.1 hypothetical protein BJ171DRAFT_539659 [Polychytrium aggregatum]
MIADYEHKFPNYTSRHGIIILNTVLLITAIWQLIFVFVAYLGVASIISAILSIITVLALGYGEYGLFTNNLPAVKLLSIWYFISVIVQIIVAILTLNAFYIVQGLLGAALTAFYALHVHAWYKSQVTGTSMV